MLARRGLALQPDPRAFFPEFSGTQIDFENAEANQARG
jgi:hypothetical protein